MTRGFFFFLSDIVLLLLHLAKLNAQDGRLCNVLAETFWPHPRLPIPFQQFFGHLKSFFCLNSLSLLSKVYRKNQSYFTLEVGQFKRVLLKNNVIIPAFKGIKNWKNIHCCKPRRNFKAKNILLLGRCTGVATIGVTLLT